MSQATLIEAFVKAQMTELALTRGQLGQRLGHNSNKALKKLDSLIKEANPKQVDFIHRLAVALEVPFKVMMDIVEKQYQIDVKAADLSYRANFKPHAIWTTQNSRPTSISMACLINAPAKLRLPFPEDLKAEAYIGYCQSNVPDVVPFYGAVTGFTINFSPDDSVVFSLDGTELETLECALRLPIAVTCL